MLTIMEVKYLYSDIIRCSRGHSPEYHRKNHSGSAKLLEPHSFVNLLAHNKNFKAANVRVDVLNGDQDAATIVHVQKVTNHTVKKWIDQNHTVKKFGFKLWSSAEKKFKFLTSDSINYLKRCFNSTIVQNKNNITGLQEAIKNISRHTFGNHESCDDWCNAQENPDQYIFKHLPNGKPFYDAHWKKKFDLILESYAQKADKIAPLQSSQGKQYFNHMAVPKYD
ncbi:hypothetical protein FQA39_LY13130 [Lamprigera yunnana]|nr:hypothetical protein FQA39_LY13130 [Lamprigera yunnana]